MALLMETKSVSTAALVSIFMRDELNEPSLVRKRQTYFGGNF